MCLCVYVCVTKEIGAVKHVYREGVRYVQDKGNQGAFFKRVEEGDEMRASVLSVSNIGFQSINNIHQAQKKKKKKKTKTKQRKSSCVIGLLFFGPASSSETAAVVGARHGNGRFGLVPQHATQPLEAEVVGAAGLGTPCDVPGVMVGGEGVGSRVDQGQPGEVGGGGDEGRQGGVLELEAVGVVADGQTCAADGDSGGAHAAGGLVDAAAPALEGPEVRAAAARAAVERVEPCPRPQAVLAHLLRSRIRHAHTPLRVPHALHGCCGAAVRQREVRTHHQARVVVPAGEGCEPVAHGLCRAVVGADVEAEVPLPRHLHHHLVVVFVLLEGCRGSEGFLSVSCRVGPGLVSGACDGLG